MSHHLYDGEDHTAKYRLHRPNYSNILLIIILTVKLQMKKFHLHSMLDVEVVKQQ
jgi:hypothetical protein